MPIPCSCVSLWPLRDWKIMNLEAFDEKTSRVFWKLFDTTTLYLALQLICSRWKMRQNDWCVRLPFWHVQAWIGSTTAWANEVNFGQNWSKWKSGKFRWVPQKNATVTVCLAISVQCWIQFFWWYHISNSCCTIFLKFSHISIQYSFRVHFINLLRWKYCLNCYIGDQEREEHADRGYCSTCTTAA